MKIEFPGIPSSFDDLPLGGFFMSELNRGGAFGLCVSSPDEKKAVIIFPNKGSSQEKASLETRGLANELFIYFAGAVLRPDLSSLVAGDPGFNYGALISGPNGGYYMRAQDGPGNHHFRTFNVENGRDENPRTTGNEFHFARWTIGSMVDQKFEPIFSFPPTS